MEMIIFRKIRSGEKTKRFNDEIDDLDDITELFQADVKKCILFLYIEQIVLHILIILIRFLSIDRTGLD